MTEESLSGGRAIGPRGPGRASQSSQVATERGVSVGIRQLRSAERDYPDLVRRCEAFDTELMADLTRAGGVRYAQIAALAFRQALAGCGLAADANNQPLLFAKENSSNGCVATVDVIYPAAPQFLLMGPSYAKALVAPALVYSTSPRWKFMRVSKPLSRAFSRANSSAASD